MHLQLRLSDGVVQFAKVSMIINPAAGAMGTITKYWPLHTDVAKEGRFRIHEIGAFPLYKMSRPERRQRYSG